MEEFRAYKTLGRVTKRESNSYYAYEYNVPEKVGEVDKAPLIENQQDKATVEVELTCAICLDDFSTEEGQDR